MSVELRSKTYTSNSTIAFMFISSSPYALGHGHPLVAEEGVEHVLAHDDPRAHADSHDLLPFYGFGLMLALDSIMHIPASVDLFRRKKPFVPKTV